ncbi:unnamed protein product, partial [marine sediment metagenome]
MFIKMNGALRTVFNTLATANAIIKVDLGFRTRVHLHFTSPRATTHTQIFQGTSKTG